jgi:hypothetical protein
LTDRLAALATRLGLSDDEALAIFQLDALAVIGGDYGHLPEIEILDSMTGEAAELVGAGPLTRWVRSSATTPTPLELLEHRDFLAFEDALDRWLRDSGVVPGSDGPAG